jgi:hypothetical protein
MHARDRITNSVDGQPSDRRIDHDAVHSFR